MQDKLTTISFDAIKGLTEDDIVRACNAIAEDDSGIAMHLYKLAMAHPELENIRCAAITLLTCCNVHNPGRGYFDLMTELTLTQFDHAAEVHNQDNKKNSAYHFFVSSGFAKIRISTERRRRSISKPGKQAVCDEILGLCDSIIEQASDIVNRHESITQRSLKKIIKRASHLVNTVHDHDGTSNLNAISEAKTALVDFISQHNKKFKDAKIDPALETTDQLRH